MSPWRWKMKVWKIHLKINWMFYSVFFSEHGLRCNSLTSLVSRGSRIKSNWTQILLAGYGWAIYWTVIWTGRTRATYRKRYLQCLSSNKQRGDKKFYHTLSKNITNDFGSCAIHSNIPSDKYNLSFIQAILVILWQITGKMCIERSCSFYKIPSHHSWVINLLHAVGAFVRPWTLYLVPL